MNPPSNAGKTIRKMSAITQAKLISLMLDGTLTCEELAEETGLHYVTVLQYTRELHRFKAAHICDWEKDVRGRDIVKVYKIGRGKDAKRQVMSPAERTARYKAKLKQRAMLNMLAGVQHAP